jgi:hypothetical protein
MSTTNLLLSANPEFKFVNASFQGREAKGFEESRTYTYKTLLNVQVTDLVVVEVEGRFKVAKVREILEPLEVDLNKFNYKWLVSAFSTEPYEASRKWNAL